MNIIGALQDNKMAFGIMETPEFTNKEMQAKAKEIGIKYFQIWLNKQWVASLSFDSNGEFTYRLRADYKEQNEYELCKIEIGLLESRPQLTYTRHDNNEYISDASDYKDFAGYLYKDKKVRHDNLARKHKDTGVIYDCIPYDEIGDYTPIRPTHVVFKK